MTTITPISLREFAEVAENLGPNILRRILTEAADAIEAQRSLLSVAICPHCDGRGWYLGSGHVCRNEQECMERCPEPIQVQCEWCDRRSSACSGSGEIGVADVLEAQQYADRLYGNGSEREA